MYKTKVDLALIQPPGWSNQNPPLGLALLKSYLAEKGFNVKIFDLNIILYNLRHNRFHNAWHIGEGYNVWEKDSYIRHLFSYYSDVILNFICSVLSHEPYIIGFSTHSPSFIAARKLAAKFRQYSPETRIIFGGPQVAYYTSNWKNLLLSKQIDGAFFGEAEESLVEYLNSEEALDNRPIKGVAYMGSENQIVVGGKRGQVSHLDQLPFADFSDFDPKFYVGTNVIPTYFSRGCINKCIYCTENKFFPGFRCRSGRRVYDEIVHQLARYPKTEFFRFHDSESNGNVKELEKLCDLLIENSINVGFNLENALVRKEMNSRLYKKLKRAGCKLIGYGLETPSKRLLKSVGKKSSLNTDIDKVITKGLRSGITIGVNMMFGLPGETEEDFELQLEFIKRHRKYRKRMIINPAINFCYFPEGCAVSMGSDKYGVDLSLGELFWSLSDGSNTFVDRARKFEAFCDLAEKLGYLNHFNITRTVNRDEMLGNYYYKKGDNVTALGHYKKAFLNEAKTLELAEKILELHAKMSLPDDQSFLEALKIKDEIDRDKKTWMDTINTRKDLEKFILNLKINDSLNRLNYLIEAMYEPPAKPIKSLRGMKTYIKYVVSKLLYVSDKKYFVLIEALKEIDNKINVLMRVNSPETDKNMRMTPEE